MRVVRLDEIEPTAIAGVNWRPLRATLGVRDRARMQGRPEEERARVDEGLAHYPDNASMLYAKACVYAVAGEREPALDFLGQAIERDKRAREWAATDEDFAAIRDDPRFPR